MIDFSLNHFELLGLPARYGIDSDALEQAYRRLQSEVHPDRYAGGSDQDKRLALQSSARVNEAYRTLRKPVERARYLLSLNGVDALSETDTQLAPEFLDRQLERRERAEEATADTDAQALVALQGDVASEATALERALADALDARNDMGTARTLVRELKFLSKLAADLNAMHVELTD